MVEIRGLEMDSNQQVIRQSKPSLPPWVVIFKKWLPVFLRQNGPNGYPLSGLKADFRATCFMELDHESLGFFKLSDFIRAVPGLCEMEIMPTANGRSHMVLFPPLDYVQNTTGFSFFQRQWGSSVLERGDCTFCFRQPGSFVIIPCTHKRCKSCCFEETAGDTCKICGARVQGFLFVEDENPGNSVPLHQRAVPLSKQSLPPPWVVRFKEWLPVFLLPNGPHGYPLSDLKADFRAQCFMELDHMSLGFFKLSAFIRAFPNLCEMKFTPTANGRSHMVLFAPSDYVQQPTGFSFFIRQWGYSAVERGGCAFCYMQPGSLTIIPCAHKVCKGCCFDKSARDFCKFCGAKVRGFLFVEDVNSGNSASLGIGRN